MKDFPRHYVKGHYILVDRYDPATRTVYREPFPEFDLLTWANWFETADRVVLRTNVMDMVEVSTVFLGMDHSFSFRGNYPPILFESLAFWFDRQHTGPMDRCASWKSAELMHWEMVERVARPRAVWEFVKECISDTLHNMSMDAWRHWRELRGLPLNPYEIMQDRQDKTYGN